MNSDFLGKEHTTITRWSEKDKEWVATYVDPDLRGLSGLGATPEIALSELKTAYRAWVDGVKPAVAVSESWPTYP